MKTSTGQRNEMCREKRFISTSSSQSQRRNRNCEIYTEVEEAYQKEKLELNSRHELIKNRY